MGRDHDAEMGALILLTGDETSCVQVALDMQKVSAYQIVDFATVVRDIARGMYNLTEEQVSARGRFRLDARWKRTPDFLMEELSERTVRDHFGSGFYAVHAEIAIERALATGASVVCVEGSYLPDMREYVDQKGGVEVRIIREPGAAFSECLEGSAIVMTVGTERDVCMDVRCSELLEKAVVYN